MLYMMKKTQIMGFQVVIIPENRSFSAWAPDIDIASQGDSIDEAIANLKEAIELHLECLTDKERKIIQDRLGKRLLTTLQVELSA